MFRSRLAKITLGVLTAMFAIILVIAIASAALAQGSPAAARFALAVAILNSAFLVGALLGFLFSLPRVLARPPLAATDTATAGAAGTARRVLQTNSNLERVSDWLTNLLVGIGLVQLNQVGAGLRSFGEFVATFEPHAAAPSNMPLLAETLLVTGVMLGFLTMYLVTRTMIVRLFQDVENGLDEAQQDAVRDAAESLIASNPSPATRDLLASTFRPGPISASDGLNVMLAKLYDADGYADTISLGEALAGSQAEGWADYWFYLAAAWGQKHAALSRASPPNQAEIDHARDMVLDNAAHAIRLNASYRTRLAALTVPNQPDDDLATLKDDPRLRRLLQLA